MVGIKKALVIRLAFALVMCQPSAAENLKDSEFIGQFQFDVTRPGKNKTLPLSMVYQLKGNDEIVLSNFQIPNRFTNNNKKQNVVATLFVVPVTRTPYFFQTKWILGSKHMFKEIGNSYVKAKCKWAVPSDVGNVGMLGIVLSPKKLNASEENINNKKEQKEGEVDKALNDQLFLHNITQLANYADLKSEADASRIEVTSWEEPSNARLLDTVLREFSARYNVDLPRLETKAAAHERWTQLLRTVIPDLIVDDQAHQQAHVDAGRVARVAASLTGLLLGNWAPVVTGVAALFKHFANIFRGAPADFQAALIQKTHSNKLIYMYSPEYQKPENVVYIGAVRIPSLNNPATVKVCPDEHLAIGQKSLLRVKNSTSQLYRARSWRLINEDKRENKRTSSIQVSQVSLNTLELDTSKMHSLKEGNYILEADWDWDSLRTTQFRLHSLPEADSVPTIDSRSMDALVKGSGSVRVELTEMDFQFVKRVELYESSVEPSDEKWQEVTGPSVFSWVHPNESSTGQAPSMDAAQRYFRLSKRNDKGKRVKLAFNVDPSKLSSGTYQLRISQSGTQPKNIPLKVHPPLPKISNLPLVINEGQDNQLTLKGKGLERIEYIKIGEDKFTIEQGSVTIKMKREEHGAEEGNCLPFQIKVRDLHNTIPRDCVKVLGPRPHIVESKEVIPPGAKLGLHDGEREIPAGALVGFYIKVNDLSSQPSLELACMRSGQVFQSELTLNPGQQERTATLDLIGEDTLFLSLDPGNLSVRDCSLYGRVTDRIRGSSNLHLLGRVTHLPRIERFVLTRKLITARTSCSPGTEDKLRYEGILTGEQLHEISRAGWNTEDSCAVMGIATAKSEDSQKQTLRIVLSWSPPEPHAPVFIWLRGESKGRATGVRY